MRLSHRKPGGAWRSTREGGYAGFKKALEMQPTSWSRLVKTSGLPRPRRGRLPDGNKWELLPRASIRAISSATPRERPMPSKEPLTDRESPPTRYSKDLIASYGDRVVQTWPSSTLRGEYLPQHEGWRPPRPRLASGGYLGKTCWQGYDVESSCTGGRRAYICGEETALLTRSRAIAANHGSNRLSRR